MKDEIRDMFETKADSLMRKLYFTVNEKNRAVNRVMLKASRISNLMQVSGYSGITVDISKENPEAAVDKILIPYDILKTIQAYNSRLTIKLAGCDITVTRDSFDLDALKRLSGAVGVKETMLEITVERKASGSVSVPFGYSYASKVYDIKIVSMGMKRTYAEINEIIYDILLSPIAQLLQSHALDLSEGLPVRNDFLTGRDPLAFLCCNRHFMISVDVFQQPFRIKPLTFRN
jgi:hypothetical protein